MLDDTEPLASGGNNDADLRKLLSVLWNSKKIIAVWVFVFVIAGMIYALSLPNIYRAQAILAPSEENSGGGLAAMASQFGGLASLAGVNLAGAPTDKATMALEVLQSRAFIKEFIHKRAIAVPLLAAEAFENGELKIDNSVYDEINSSWSSDVLRANEVQPTDWDLYKLFKESFQVKRDKVSGLVTLSVEHISPVVAKQWVDWLVEDLNMHMRQTDIKEARTSVDFLEKQLTQTSVADMHKMFYQLIEKQYQTIMLASVREQYMFKVLDPAVVPQEKFKPQRLLVVMISVFFGFFTCVFYLAVKKYS